MQKALKSKENLLDQFYQHLEEDDWLDGLDIYQAGRVFSLETYGELVTAKVSGMTARNEEVRLKKHPTGHCIQWIECTCRKNRSHGQYCEHIAAFMIHVDREKPEIFSTLDTSMPIKPPANQRKRQTATQTSRKGASRNQNKSAATQTILEHLRGNIQSVSMLAGGPTIRVRIEIKEGQLTHYDLDLDSAAKFLKSKRNQITASPEVTSLEIFSEKVELGTRIYLADDEKIIAERTIAIAVPRKPSPKQLAKIKPAHDHGKYVRYAGDNANHTETHYIFLPLKSAAKYVGKEFFFLPDHGYWPLASSSINQEWYDLPLTKTFKDDDAANLVASNYDMFLSKGPLFLATDLSGQTILDAPELSEIKVVTHKDGWFKLDPRYGKGKGSVSMAALMKQHKQKKRKFIKSGKHWLKIPEFVTEHDWELDDTEEAIKVDAMGLMRLKAAFGEFDQFVGSKRILNSLRKKLEFSAETDLPDLSHTKLDLRHYQELGLKWLWWLYNNELHGLLADEMGLGKTHQAMGLMSAISKGKKNCKFLVVAPTTVLDHWMDKIEAFAPKLRPVKYHGTKRTHQLNLLDGDHQVLVTSYGILLRDTKSLSEMEWDAFILDEAHFVKNNDTATYKAACKINSKIRVCLTGTPLENHLGELKNLFDFLVPGYLGSDDYFKKNFIRQIENEDAPDTEIALQKLIHPFKMRRTKDLVLPDLPAKVEDLRHCSLSATQVKLYRDVIELKARPLVNQLQNEESPIPFLHVFATLTLLKQICNHPSLVNGGKWDSFESGKFDLLRDLIDDALGSNHKIVIYTQYVQMIELISSYLKSKEIGHVTLSGQTRNRGKVINQFQTDDDTKIFIGSLLAGGIGIDLTAASVVIHYDRWWNASKENQATDRVHRIGQNKNVQVIKMISRGTLEEKIDKMISAKQKLFEKFLDKDEELFKTLSRHELIELLQ